jgi:hypothetical protein
METKRNIMPLIRNYFSLFFTGIKPERINRFNKLMLTMKPFKKIQMDIDFLKYFVYLHWKTNKS